MAKNAKPIQIDRAIAAFESTTRLCVTVHDLDGRLAPFVPAARQVHGQRLCQMVKQSAEGWRCYEFEVTRLRADWARWPDGRVHRCHAGLVEWMVPMAWDGRLLGVLFAGQVRSAGGSCDLVQLSSSAAKRWAGRVVTRRVDRDHAQRILEQLRQLAARLVLWVLRSGATAVDGRAAVSRRAQVEAFVRDRHTQPGLAVADLAAVLHLSESRTSHLVRELFGRGFVQLITAARVGHACDLLRHSAMPVLQVGQAAGFTDPAHFHRVFKKHLRQTPRRYREATA